MIGDTVAIENNSQGVILGITNNSWSKFCTQNDNWRIDILCDTFELPVHRRELEYMIRPEFIERIPKDTCIQRHPSDLRIVRETEIHHEELIGNKNANGDEICGIVRFDYYSSKNTNTANKWMEKFSFTPNSLVYYVNLARPSIPFSFEEFVDQHPGKNGYTDEYMKVLYNREKTVETLSIPACIFRSESVVI